VTLDFQASGSDEEREGEKKLKVYCAAGGR